MNIYGITDSEIEQISSGDKKDWTFFGIWTGVAVTLFVALGGTLVSIWTGALTIQATAPAMAVGGWLVACLGGGIVAVALARNACSSADEAQMVVDRAIERVKAESKHKSGEVEPVSSSN
jgi:hypothetical protein